MFAGLTGLTGTFGFSARLTGGGTEELFAEGVGEGSRDARGAPTDLELGDTGSLERTGPGGLLALEWLVIGLRSELPRLKEGQFPPICPFASRGGERGDSTVKLGGICGAVRKFIDKGHPFLRKPGDFSRLESIHGGFDDLTTADTGPFSELPPTPHDKLGRGRSRDARTSGCVSSK